MMKVYNRPMAEGEQRTNGRSLEDRIHTSWRQIGCEGRERTELRVIAGLLTCRWVG